MYCFVSAQIDENILDLISVSHFELSVYLFIYLFIHELFDPLINCCLLSWW